MYNCSASLRASIRSLLLPFLTAFFRVLHTRTSVTWDFSRSYNQVAQVPSSKTTRKSPRSPSRNCRIVLAFVSMTPSITILPREFLTAIEVLSVCTSIPIYLTLAIKGCSFPEKFEQRTQTVLQRGALFIMCWFGRDKPGLGVFQSRNRGIDSEVVADVLQESFVWRVRR